MGRSAKKKANVINRLKSEIRCGGGEFDDEKEHEFNFDLGQHVFQDYSKFLHFDQSKKSLIWTASINSSPTGGLSSFEKEDFLLRFINLLEENRAELEPSIAKKKQFTFRDRRVTAKNKSSEILVKNMLAEQPLISTSSLMAETFFSNLFSSAFMNKEPAFNLIFTLLNDRIYQIFSECSSRAYRTLERVNQELQHLAEMRVRIEANNSLDYSDFIDALVRASPTLLKEAECFYKELPGLNKLNVADFSKITQAKMLDYYFIINSVLFIDGESYFYISGDIIYTRFWMSLIRPQEFVDGVFDFMSAFNVLKLSKREKALLIAHILTQPGKLIVRGQKKILTCFSKQYVLYKIDVEVNDGESLKELNQYYTRALLYEFDINIRGVDFYPRLKKVIQLN
jgi:hypothetical protein